MPGRLRAPPPPEPGIVKRLLSPPDALQVDAGAQGELLVARVRSAVVLLLLPIPLSSVLFGNNAPKSAVGTQHQSRGADLLRGIAVLHLMGRGFYRPWLGFATSLMDVTFVSAPSGSFSCWESRTPPSTAARPSRCISSPSGPPAFVTTRDSRSRRASWRSSSTPRWS